MLEELVQRDSLNVREVELFKAVDCWATERMSKARLSSRRFCGKKNPWRTCLKAIRFPVMKEKEFADVVLDCDVLTKKALCDMMKYFNSLLNFPVGFAKVKRCGPRWVSQRPKI